jgi:hypothetical protein
MGTHLFWEREVDNRMFEARCKLAIGVVVTAKSANLSASAWRHDLNKPQRIPSYCLGSIPVCIPRSCDFIR